MALRDQPYIPLYVQDFLTDEKLVECSAESCGVYIRLMCIMHKSEEYGTILLRQKDKQTKQHIENFAFKLSKQMPYTQETIHNSLHELIDECVIQIKGDKLLQKRMMEDNRISLVRAKAGKKGGFATAKSIANNLPNSENENAIENENVIKDKDGKDIPSQLYIEINCFIAGGMTDRVDIKNRLLKKYTEHDINEAWEHIEWHKNKEKK